MNIGLDIFTTKSVTTKFLVCYINTATHEKIEIPQSVIDTIMFDEEDVEDEDEIDPSYADLRRIRRDWEQTITITHRNRRNHFLLWNSL